MYSIGTPSRKDGTNCVVLNRLCPPDYILGATTSNKEAIAEDREEEDFVDQEETVFWNADDSETAESRDHRVIFGSDGGSDRHIYLDNPHNS